MVPLLVRARLGSGVGHAPPWGISLDGLLASQIRENEKAAARESGTDYIPYDSEALTTKIRAFINGWNPRAQPFVWTKTAEHILGKANRRKTSRTPH